MRTARMQATRRIWGAALAMTLAATGGLYFAGSPDRAEATPAIAALLASSSASPTASGSPTDSPTPTDTATATPTGTPTETGSPTPGPTGSPPEPIILPAPYEGRYRSNSCATYFPMTQNAPCTATGDADASTGAATATATIESIEGGLTTMASSNASAGVTQTVDDLGYRMVVRFRVDRASVRVERSAGSLGQPSGSVTLSVAVENACGSNYTTRGVPIDVSGDVEGEIFEVMLDTQSCDTATSLRMGLQADAVVSPLSSGRATVDAAVTVLRATILR